MGSGVICFGAGELKYLQSLQKKQAHIIDVKEPQTPLPDVVAPFEPSGGTEEKNGL